MSRFENYTGASANYDLTRRPAAMELILGAFACGSRPLPAQIIRDVGCGTGNYAAALAGKVRRVDCVEFNAGMLKAARVKLSDHPGVQLCEGNILDLPYENGSGDGVMVNFVLHHLEEGTDSGFAATRRAVAECHRVLAPGGTLIIQTCSPAQYRHGYWYSALIPEAIDRALVRYIPLKLLEESMIEAGLRPGGRLVPLDEVLQGDAYLDPRGPMRREWGDGEASWALVEEVELARVIGEIERMLGDDSMGPFLVEREACRREHGQATFVVGRRPRR